MADRVALKLDHSPEWLTDEEIRWLSKRAGLGISDLWKAINEANNTAANKMHALTRLFDPCEDDANDPESRRKRMERFRRRRARAREKLKALIQEVQ